MKRALVLTLLLLTASTAAAEIFTWADRGIRHYTNSIHEVPARFRNKVKVLDVPTGKKLTPTAAQLAGQTQPDQPGAQPAGAAPTILATPAPVPVAPPVPPAIPASPVAPAQAPALQAAPTRVPALTNAAPGTSPAPPQVRASRRRHAPGGSREE